jgi:membrane-bound lytic murein transglycosylase B
MPSNYRRYGVDADADGRIDLWSDWPDVCASVGNYLKEHGWIAGEPVLEEASVAPERAADLDGRKLILSETVASLMAKGVSFESALPGDAPTILIAADEADGVHWRVGYNNFYVITRYNHSALYAMAVYELAGAVKQRMLEKDAAQLATSASPASPATSAPVTSPPATAPVVTSSPAASP